MLATGDRYNQRGLTLYTKPTPDLEVGFLIRRRAGNAVKRNRTRRLFWGLVTNHQLSFPKQGTFLFLFHRHFRDSQSLLLLTRRLLETAGQ